MSLEIVNFVTLTLFSGGFLYVWLNGRRVTQQLHASHQKAAQNIKRLNNLYAALSRVNGAIMRIGDRETLLNEICHIAVEYGQFKLAWVGLLNEVSGEIEVIAFSGSAHAYLEGIHLDVEQGGGLIDRVMRDNREYICNDFLNDPQTRPWRESAARFGLRAAASCPLEMEGCVVGALTLYAEDKDYFDQAMTNLLSDFSTDISLALNIFARKERRGQVEKKLEESEGKFRTLVDNLPQMIFVKDVNSVYIACNVPYAESLGVAPAELIGKTDYDFYPQAQASKYREYDRKILTEGGLDSFEERRILHGREIVVHAAKAIFKDNQGRVLGVLGVLTDISEQKKYEEIRAEIERDGRLNLAKEMASGLAHELSQPLAAVSNYLVACQRRMEVDGDWDKEKLRAAVRLALGQSERAASIIGHIKGLVKKQGYEHAWLNVNLLAESSLVFLEDEVTRCGITVKMDLQLLPEVMACQVEIVQVLLNLYKNAIEAMSASTQRVLTVTTSMSGADEVMVAVGDTGGGVLPEQSERVFNPFQTSKAEGLGLGLAICRNFVDHHGGRIWVESAGQSGAKFCFTLAVHGRSAQ